MVARGGSRRLRRQPRARARRPGARPNDVDLGRVVVPRIRSVTRTRSDRPGGEAHPREDAIEEAGRAGAARPRIGRQSSVPLTSAGQVRTTRAFGDAGTDPAGEGEGSRRARRDRAESRPVAGSRRAGQPPRSGASRRAFALQRQLLPGEIEQGGARAAPPGSVTVTWIGCASSGRATPTMRAIARRLRAGGVDDAPRPATGPRLVSTVKPTRSRTMPRTLDEALDPRPARLRRRLEGGRRRERVPPCPSIGQDAPHDGFGPAGTAAMACAGSARESYLDGQGLGFLRLDPRPLADDHRCASAGGRSLRRPARPPGVATRDRPRAPPPSPATAGCRPS